VLLCHPCEIPAEFSQDNKRNNRDRKNGSITNMQSMNKI